MAALSSTLAGSKRVKIYPMLRRYRWPTITVLVVLPFVIFLLLQVRMSWLRPRSWPTGPGGVYAVAFSSDGKFLVTGTSERMWRTGRKNVHTWPTYQRNNRVQIWNVETEEGVRVFKPSISFRQYLLGDITANLTFAHDNQSLMCYGKFLQIYDVTTGKLRRTIARDAHVVAVSPDGTLIASQNEDEATAGIRAGYGHIRITDAKTLKLKRILKGADWIQCAAFSPDNIHFASALFDAGVSARNRHLHLWDLKMGRRISRLPNSDGDYKDVVFSPNGQQLVPLDNAGVKVWDVKTRIFIRQIQYREHSTVIAFSPDSSVLAIGSLTGIVRLVDTKTFNTTREITTSAGYKLGVESLAFSPDGSLLEPIVARCNCGG